MKVLSIPAVALTIMLTVSSCGAPQATPTVSAADIQGTVAAAASTMIAQTLAAIPTATPAPPTATITDTPPPTNTFLPVPPSGVPVTALPSGNSAGADPCINQVLPESLQGKPVKIRVNNSTKATVSVSVYLQQAGPGGVCGYRSYTIAPGQFILINDLVEGCYTLWAWNPDPDGYFMVTNGTSCIDSSDTSVFGISTKDLRLGP